MSRLILAFAKWLHLRFCTTPECSVCGVLACPGEEPLHYHHDGCPVCSYAEEDDL